MHIFRFLNPATHYAPFSDAFKMSIRFSSNSSGHPETITRQISTTLDLQHAQRISKAKMLANDKCQMADHVIMGCPFAFAKEFRAKIGFHLPLVSTGAPGEVHNIQRPAIVPQKHFSTFVALCCWQLWKCRNGASLLSVVGNYGSAGMG